MRDAAVITIFGTQVYVFGLGLAAASAAVLLALALLEKHLGIKKGTTPLLEALSLALGFLCSRAVYCLVCLDYYVTEIAQPMRMLAFWDGGYSLFGALLGVCLACLITGRITKQPIGALLDGAALVLPAWIAAERLLESATILGLGREVVSEALKGSAFFAVEDMSGYLSHPVYRYEAVCMGLLCIGMIILTFFFKTGKVWPKGDKALLGAAAYGCCQALLESLRNDGHMLWGFVRANQVFAALLVMLTVAIFTIRIIRAKRRVTLPCWLGWLGCLAALGGAMVQEFAIDSSANLFVDYGIMAAELLALLALCFWLRSQSDYSYTARHAARMKE